MSDYQSVEIERRGPVAVVTMNRPAALNSFDASLRREILLAAREVNGDDSIRVVVLTGAGRGFGAGADLSELPMEDPNWRVEDQLNLEYKPVMLEIYNAPKPWISAVHGPAAGVSSAFAMVCDLTVMAENAYIYQAFAAISLVPDGGATWHLVRTIGRKRAYEVIATGEKLSAQKCLDWGLCNRVVATEKLLEETLAWAEELAARAPLSLRYSKQAVARACEADLEQTISEEAQLQGICIDSQDAAEGTAAFLEKRPPVWQGR
ncbi:enoyl-CoA hydratase/isomerase family protein [Seongchinamella sediminis]|uniref:Enoyl-CoA hydratase/isomerase family protein n=1 Tax=Seongchinamella sediminis TaxID=2283635 RepID=A0A3L7E0G7_9GAMM|nr:enoyl-CoA hydratase/isomerase family protein [Seongchinamella sediminis]RLQ21612.1 enoyl-CoA hydratase/isomerase family protein [Seongchinamella sediminis]